MRKYIFDFLQYLKIGKNVSPHTERSYLSDLDQFFDFLGETDLAAVDHKTLRLFIAHLLKLKLKKSSIARKLAALRAFYKYLNRQGILSSNPARLIATPRQEKRLPAVLTADDAQRLMDAPAAPASPHGPTELRDRAVLETLYSTGIRASELIGMNHDDINRHDRLIRIRGKGRKERIVPLGAIALAAIDAYVDQQQRNRGLQRCLRRSGRKTLDSPYGSAYFRNLQKKTGAAAESEPAHAPPQLRDPHARIRS